MLNIVNLSLFSGVHMSSITRRPSSNVTNPPSTSTSGTNPPVTTKGVEPASVGQTSSTAATQNVKALQEPALQKVALAATTRTTPSQSVVPPTKPDVTRSAATVDYIVAGAGI